MQHIKLLALTCALALTASLSAQSFTVTPYGPSCGPVATGYVTPNGNTNRFFFTVSQAAPSSTVMLIVGVHETAVPIEFGTSCLLLTNLGFTQTHRTSPAGEYTWSHAMSASYTGGARVQFAEITTDAQGALVVRTTNGLFMQYN